MFEEVFGFRGIARVELDHPEIHEAHLILRIEREDALVGAAGGGVVLGLESAVSLGDGLGEDARGEFGGSFLGGERWGEYKPEREDGSEREPHFPASSPERRSAARTASINAARTPRFSSSVSAAAVVPPGLVTISRSTAGCSEVAFASSAAPRTV